MRDDVIAKENSGLFPARKGGREMTRKEKFLEKLALHLTEDEQEKVLAAYMFSKYGHSKQVRDCGQRYFEHPRAVANIIIDELKLNDNWRIIVTALLHDILEDSWLLNEKRIAINFGKRAARWIILLTKTPGVDYLDRLSQCHEWEVLLVKLSDRLHNLRSLSACSKEKQERCRRETRIHYLPLADALIKLLLQEDRWRGEYLKREIEKLI